MSLLVDGQFEGSLKAGLQQFHKLDISGWPVDDRERFAAGSVECAGVKHDRTADLAEVALVGKAPGRYNLLLGADASGQRLNVLHLENADEARILEALDGLFERYARDRAVDERFGDWLWRAGVLDATRGVHPPRREASA